MEPLRITEVLANPAGTDRGAEWIELCSGDAPVRLSAYALTVGTRRLVPAGTLAARSCSILRTGTAAIRNREADIALWHGGRLVQAVRTAGTAPENQGFHVTADASFWASSTPGVAEGVAPLLPPVPDIPAPSVLLGAIGTAVCTAGILALTAYAALKHARARHHELA